MLKITTLKLKLGLKKVDGLGSFVGQSDCICEDQVVLNDEKILESLFLLNLKIFLDPRTLL